MRDLYDVLSETRQRLLEIYISIDLENAPAVAGNLERLFREGDFGGMECGVQMNNNFFDPIKRAALVISQVENPFVCILLDNTNSLHFYC